MTAAAEVEVTAAAAAEVVENEAVRTLSIQCGFTLHTINEHGSLGGIQSVLNRYQYRVSYHFLQIASFTLTACLSTLGWYALWVDALNRCDVLPLASTQLTNSLNSIPSRNSMSVRYIMIQVSRSSFKVRESLRAFTLQHKMDKVIRYRTARLWAINSNPSQPVIISSFVNIHKIIRKENQPHLRDPRTLRNPWQVATMCLPKIFQKKTATGNSDPKPKASRPTIPRCPTPAPPTLGQNAGSDSGGGYAQGFSEALGGALSANK